MIAPGVVDRHGSMLEADHVMDDGGHDLPSRFGVTMRNGHGDFLVAAENHLGVGLSAALIVDERIVNAAKARPGVERDVFDA
jgi:hypothetical protein